MAVPDTAAGTQTARQPARQRQKRYHAWPRFLRFVMSMALTLPRPFATRLLFEAQKKPDEEVCGLVGQDDDGRFYLHPVANVAADRRRCFEMDPQGQIRAMRQMREAGQSLLAIYHSHPDTPPEPSSRDLDALGHPDALYLIISLNIKGVLEMRGWRRTADGVEEVTLRVMQ